MQKKGGEIRVTRRGEVAKEARMEDTYEGALVKAALGGKKKIRHQKRRKWGEKTCTGKYPKKQDRTVRTRPRSPRGRFEGNQGD